MYVCVFVCMYICMYVCMYVCEHVYPELHTRNVHCYPVLQFSHIILAIRSIDYPGFIVPVPGTIIVSDYCSISIP